MVINCDWSPDGKYLGACFTDKQVKICQLEFSGTLRVIQTLPCSLSVRQVIWNPTDYQRFAIIGMDKVIELWDVRAPRATSKIPCKITATFTSLPIHDIYRSHYMMQYLYPATSLMPFIRAPPIYDLS